MITLLLNNPVISKIKDVINTSNSDSGVVNDSDSNSDNDINNNNTKNSSINSFKKDSEGNTVEIDLDTFDNLNQQDVNTYVKKILLLDTSFPNNYLQGVNGKTYHELEFLIQMTQLIIQNHFFNILIKLKLH